jgi:exodeoxyribonuclease VII large subunit
MHQQLREMRASSRRRVEVEVQLCERRALVLARKAESVLLDCRSRRPRELERLALALAGHDPLRTLERGYALVTSAAGEVLPTAAAARAARDVRVRFADGAVPAHIAERNDGRSERARGGNERDGRAGERRNDRREAR